MLKKGKRRDEGPKHKRHQDHMENNQLRKALRRQRQARIFLDENDKSFISLNLQLNARGLKLKQIMGDGNCLFRALADQYEQDNTKHWQYRAQVCEFILDNAPDFRPFVEDEMSLERFVQELSKDGVFGGNETLVAFSRLRSVDIVIHQLDELPWKIKVKPGVEAKIALHLAYHNDEDHYSSVVPAFQKYDEKPPPVKVQSHVSVQSRETSLKSAKTVRPTHHEADYTSKDIKHRQTNKIDNLDLPQPKNFSTGGGADALPAFDDLYIQVQQATGCKDNATICQALEDSDWDMSSALAQVLQIMSIGQDSNIPFDVFPDDVKGLQDHGLPKVIDVHEPKEKPKQQHPNAKSYPSKKQQGAQVTLSNKKRKELAKAERKSRRVEAQKKDKPDHGNKPYFEDDFDGDFEGLAI